MNSHDFLDEISWTVCSTLYCRVVLGVYHRWQPLMRTTKNSTLMTKCHALLSWWRIKRTFVVRWNDMVGLPQTIQSEDNSQSSTHTGHNRSRGPHTNTNMIYVCLEAYTQLLFLCWGCPLCVAAALLSWHSGWALPKWTCWLTASDKLSTQLISITTSLASPACMIDSTLNSYLGGLLSHSLLYIVQWCYRGFEPPCDWLLKHRSFDFVPPKFKHFSRVSRVPKKCFQNPV